MFQGKSSSEPCGKIGSFCSDEFIETKCLPVGDKVNPSYHTDNRRLPRCSTRTMLDSRNTRGTQQAGGKVNSADTLSAASYRMLDTS
jgi:hypothetical protein